MGGGVFIVLGVLWHETPGFDFSSEDLTIIVTFYAKQVVLSIMINCFAYCLNIKYNNFISAVLQFKLFLIK